MALSKKRVIETVSILVIIIEVFAAIKLHADIRLPEPEAHPLDLVQIDPLHVLSYSSFI